MIKSRVLSICASIGHEQYLALRCQIWLSLLEANMKLCGPWETLQQAANFSQACQLGKQIKEENYSLIKLQCKLR